MFNKLFTWGSKKTAPEPSSARPDVSVCAPVSGRIVPLDQVSDPVFSQKMLGDGIAIEPASRQILAPFAGTVVATFPTGHAIGLRSLTGLECLIHIGIDTVTLEGRGFRLLVKQDQTVRQGAPLIELDLDLLRASGKDLVIPIVITNSDCWQICERWQSPNIAAGTDILFTARPAGKDTL